MKEYHKIQTVFKRDPDNATESHIFPYGSHWHHRLVRALIWLLCAAALTYANTHTDWIWLRFLTGMELVFLGWILPDVLAKKRPNAKDQP